MISILKGIIIGIIGYIVFIPVLESLASLIVQLLEVMKGWLIVLLAKAQHAAKMYRNTPTQDNTNVRAIGFSTNNEESYEEDEDDE